MSWGNRVVTPTSDDLINLEGVKIEANSDRLRQSIINVLENASKYSPPTKPVELSVLRVDENICFDVRDYGSGIPEDEFNTIFQPFRRGEATSNGTPGSGVGLALVFQLVKLMNGRIYVLRSSDEGTVMRFEFPVVSNS